jgi:hypothetical protein
MWYVFVAELPPEPHKPGGSAIHGGFVGGQYARQADALAIYDQAKRNLKPGERIYPPFEASDPLAARRYINGLDQAATQENNAEA